MKSKDAKFRTMAGKLSKINENLDKLITANEAALEVNEKKMAEAQTKIDAANIKLVEATETGDPAAYHHAKDALREAQDLYEMHKLIYDRKKSEPLTTCKEEGALKSAIFDVNEELRKYAAGEIYDLLKEAEALADDYTALVEIENQMLRKLRSDVMRKDPMMSEAVLNIVITCGYHVSNIDALKQYFE